MAASEKKTKEKLKSNFVYGLDIGTRSIVGTVGYPDKGGFVVVAQESAEHETRAMIDGQIHDIAAVGATIRKVTDRLEKETGEKLKSVCIAAAGRVLRTVNTSVEVDFEEEKTVTREDIFALDSLGVEKAYEIFFEENKSELKFYCVGYTVKRYFLNHYPMSNLENHKARSISAELIATFLPDEVVDGLYKAVEIANLEVANLTLEPIAAMEVAIPESYRMLNIALIDVGAGTSDISITRGGSIVAYGMLPAAGDMLTEEIAMHCLVDFATAEDIKRGISISDEVEYKDIMGLTQKISKEEVLDTLSEKIDLLAREAADKIKELNGDKSVSAVFVVGGGGKIAGYTDSVADKLKIARERCALRGEEVMGKITFLQKDIVKDSLLVTPIGICLNFYQQSNNFIFVSFNGNRIKLYDNSHLAVVDAAMGAGFSNEDLFPKRGKELVFTFNGKERKTRGQLGESCVITVNGKPADIGSPIHSNDVVVVEPSTAGEPGKLTLAKLPEIKETISIIVNGEKYVLPKFASVNGNLETAGYEIKQGDKVELLPYYTVEQITELMDVKLDDKVAIMINHELSDMNGKVYDNFSLEWGLASQMTQMPVASRNGHEGSIPADDAGNGITEDEYNGINASSGTIQGISPAMSQSAARNVVAGMSQTTSQGMSQGTSPGMSPSATQNATTGMSQSATNNTTQNAAQDALKNRTPSDNRPVYNRQINVMINKMPYTMKGKSSYVYVDAFDYIDFDLSRPQGKSVETLLNGRRAGYMEELKNGDVLSISWKN